MISVYYLHLVFQVKSISMRRFSFSSNIQGRRWILTNKKTQKVLYMRTYHSHYEFFSFYDEGVEFSVSVLKILDQLKISSNDNIW